MTDWFLYMIRCSDGTLYTGITTDVKRRFTEHSGEGAKGAKYLRGRVPLQLVFHKAAGNRGRAMELERKVKKLSKREKERLVKGDIKISDFFSAE